MKKNYLFGLLSLFTLLFAASCQEEEMAGGQYGDTAAVTFKVNTPTIATRAVGDGQSATKLYVAVYENQNGTEANPNLVGPLPVSKLGTTGFEATETFTDRVATVILQLAKNKEYSVIFWAANTDSTMFNIDWKERTLDVKDAIYANVEGYDAFWAQKTVKLTGALSENVELKRPFAQLNIGTSDKAAAADAGIVVEKSQVKTKVFTTFDLQSGQASDEDEVTYSLASMTHLNSENFPAAAAGQEYLSLNYLLMNTDKSIVDIEFQYKDEDDNAPYTLSFAAVPVQRNYRTNIYGTLLTNSANYTVEIKPGFGNDGEEDVANIVYASTAEEVQKALNAAAEDSTVKVVLLNDITLNGQTAAYTTNAKNVIIESNQQAATRGGSEGDTKFTLTFKDGYRTYFGLANEDAKVTFNNVNIYRESTGGSHWHDNNMKFTCNAEFNNVDFNKGICFDNAKTFVMNNCSINKGKVATYALFITAGCDVTIDGLSVTHSEGVAGRGIKIVDEDVKDPQLTTLSVSNATFVTESKAAIMVGSSAGANIKLSNLDLSGVKADQFNAVWVDEDYKDYADKVTVSGGFKAVEGDKAATDAANPFLVENATVPVAKGVYSALPKVANGVTIEAEEGTVFTGTSSVSGKNVTIKNVTFKGEDKALTGSLYGTTFENCHFDATYGAQWCYATEGEIVFTGCTFGSETSKRGVHFDSGEGSVRFESCTFYGFNALGGSLEKLTFNDCDIKVSSKAHNGFNGVNMYGTTYEYNNCRFEPGTYTDCAANNVVASYTNCSYTDGNSIYSLVRFDKDPATCTITFDGKLLIATSAQLASAVAAMEGTEATFLLAKSTFALPTSLTGKTLVLEGADKEATIIDMTHGGTPQYGAQSVTFKNLTMKRKADWIGGFAHSQAEHYEDCIVEGTLVTYCPTVTATRTNFVPAAKEYYNVHLYSPGQMTFTECNFSTTRGRCIYAHHDTNASEYNITINGCTFTTGEMTADDSQNQAAIRLHTEAGIHGTLTINNSTATGWKADHNGGLWVEWNNGTKKYTNNFVKLIDGQKPVVTVTPGNIASIEITSNETFKLVGDFGSKNVSFVMAEGVENVVFDGSQAININELIITQNGQIIDNANDVIGTRSGNVTVQKFNILSQINVFACKTEVVVQENTAEALMIHAGNCDVKVLNNTIDANFESHPTYKDATNTWNNNDYGIALNIFEYNLWFEGNTITDAKGHAMGINGWEGTFDTGVANKIKSFTRNNITVNSTTKTKRAAFKVWDDETYASNDGDTNAVNATAQAFINTVLGDNTNVFNITAGYDHTKFCFYNVNTNE